MALTQEQIRNILRNQRLEAALPVATALQPSTTRAMCKSGAVRTPNAPRAVARVMVLSAVMCLAGCTYDAIDYLYEDSVRFQGRLGRLNVEEGPRLYPDLVTKEDYLSDGYTSHDHRQVIGRRKMEKDLVALLRAKCPIETYSCAIRELERLGFQCVEADGKAECSSERRTRHPALHNPIKWYFEDQLWTVVIEPQANGANMQARLQFLGPHN
jgi:hypothetical protein